MIKCNVCKKSEYLLFKVDSFRNYLSLNCILCKRLRSFSLYHGNKAVMNHMKKKCIEFSYDFDKIDSKWRWLETFKEPTHDEKENGIQISKRNDK